MTLAKRKRDLNHMTRAAYNAKLGDMIVDLTNQHAALLADVTALRTRLNTGMLTSAGLVIKAGSSAIVKAVTAFAAIIDGAPVYKAAATDMSALVGTLATAKSAAWAFYIDSAGTITTAAKTADVATHALAVAAVAAPTDNKALIGFIVVDNATGSNFVGGTTALDAASLTVTYYNVVGSAVYAAAITSVAVTGIENR